MTDTQFLLTFMICLIENMDDDDAARVRAIAAAHGVSVDP